jgi:O-antigen/teichoic acid export membrane protein
MSEPSIAPDAVFDLPRPPAPAGRLPMAALQSIVLRFGAFGLNAVTGILTARALHPDGRGHLAAMVIWPTLLAGLTTFGLPSALVYHLRRDPQRASRLLGWSLLLCVVGSFLGTAVAWYVIPLWLQQQPHDIIVAAQFYLLTTCVTAVTLLGRAAWEARGQFARSNVSQVITPIVVIIGLSVQMAFGVLTPISAAACYLLGGIPALTWILISVTRSFRPTLESGREVSHQLLHYGGRSYGIDLAGTLASYVDQALVVGLLSPASMGIYVVAMSLSRVLGAVHSVVASIVFPKVVGLEHGDLTRAVARSARMAMLASGAMGAVLLITGPWLLRWVYGPSFAAATTILPILLVEMIVSGLSFIFVQGFLAAGRPGTATMIQLVTVAASIPIFLLLVPAFGIIGAACAMLIASTMRLALTMGLYKPILGVPAPRLWIDAADIAELTHYRGTLVSSLGRLRAAGETK